jgi:hypothetical protein
MGFLIFRDFNFRMLRCIEAVVSTPAEVMLRKYITVDYFDPNGAAVEEESQTQFKICYQNYGLEIVKVHVSILAAVLLSTEILGQRRGIWQQLQDIDSGMNIDNEPRDQDG